MFKEYERKAYEDFALNLLLFSISEVDKGKCHLQYWVLGYKIVQTGTNWSGGKEGERTILDVVSRRKISEISFVDKT